MYNSPIKGVCVMKINPIVNSNPSQTNFKAVNQKYLKWAEKDYKVVKNISGYLLESLRDDVCLFGDISPKDGVDTMNAIRKYMAPEGRDFFEHVLDNNRNA